MGSQSTTSSPTPGRGTMMAADGIPPLDLSEKPRYIDELRPLAAFRDLRTSPVGQSDRGAARRPVDVSFGRLP